ncbi:tripartite motif-containing protein 2-like [Ptychodera flava]|uniref:tripartite motif-containing protein 2-like n=1 Tax=Ptychodera flava TaxID=63121 RepID=UPI00396A80FE
MERVAETDNVWISTEVEEGSESARWKDSLTDETSGTKEQPSLASQYKKGDWSVRFTDGYSQKTGRKFKQPRGMVFHGNLLVVCDPENNIVRILNEDYRCDKVLGSFDGRFARPFKPWDVAVSDESHYFMNDRGNFQIVVCDEDNKILTLISLTWDIDVHGITICLGFLVVTDARGHRLLKYTKGGKYVSEINNKELCGLSQFNRPYSVAVNSSGEIGVSDHWNHCIKRFDDELKFRDKYGELGRGDGQLWYPFGMDIDNNDDVYVCDGGNHRIVKCKSDGSWSGDLFCDVWQLRNPRYIAVQKDRIAVAELDNSNIKIFYK